MTTEYAGNYVYENSALQFFNHPQGYVEPDGSTWDYAYQYTDHLGNIRLSYSDDNGNGSIATSEIREENNYYPFGLKHKGYNDAQGAARDHKFEFQGQEYTEDLGLNLQEFKYRMHDPSIGRFIQIDPLAEDYVYNSTYAFAENKVIANFELEGLEAVSVNGEYDPNATVAEGDGVNLLDEVVLTPQGGDGDKGVFNEYAKRVTDNTFIVGAKTDDPTYGFIYPRSLGDWNTDGSDGLRWIGCLSCHAPNGAYRYAAYNSQERIAGLMGAALLNEVIFLNLGNLGSSPTSTRNIDNYPDGSFSIIDWTGYPNGPRPQGPFRLIEGAEYTAQRNLANNTNRSLRKSNPNLYRGKQIHEIKPIKFDGSPTDLSNKIPLSPTEHAQFTTYFNRLMRNIQ